MLQQFANNVVSIHCSVIGDMTFTQQWVTRWYVMWCQETSRHW